MNRGGGAKSVGFTIVELLIVVVVIAILAAITIVAFSGIQNRAKDSAVQTGAAQAAKKLAVLMVSDSDQYPLASDFTSATGISDSADVAYDYIVSSDRKKYCLSARSSANPDVAYAKVSTSGETISGRCLRNHALNPSFESSAYTSVGDTGGASTDSSRAASTAWASAGTSSNLVTKTVSTGNPKGTKIAITQIAAVGDVVNWKATIRNNVATSRSFQLYGERGSPTYAALSGSSCQAIAATSVATISGGLTITASNNGQIGLGVLPCGANFTVGESYAVDGFFIAINQPVPSGYYDGNSPNWVWDGGQSISSSFGPASL